jgi:hypothetical protein
MESQVTKQAAARKQKPAARKPRGKTATHYTLLKRVFNGLPVADAKKEMVIHAIDADIKSAKRGDPLNCVFAKACLRIFGSHNVAFFRNYAYVEKGAKIERFSLPKATRDSVMVFDKAGAAEPGGYLLRPPSPGDTLDRRLARNREMRPASHWKAPSSKKRAKAPDVDFRSGTGLVQFLRAEKSWSRGAS